MAANVIADAGFLIALLTVRDANRSWAREISEHYPPPWKTCESALAEAFHLLAPYTAVALVGLLRRQAVTPAFHLADNIEAVLALMQKYADMPMSFADACLVRMTEVLPDPVLLTTDSDFRIYRRHGRHVVPCVTPR